jgi:hypothetical protein
MYCKLRRWLTRTAIAAGLCVAASGVARGSGAAGGPAGGAGGTTIGGNPALGGAGSPGGVGGAGISGGSAAIGGSGPSGGGVVTGPGATGIPQNYSRGAMPGMGEFPQEAPSGQSPQPRSGLRGSNRRSGLGGNTRSGGSGAMGRGRGALPPGGDENPAETLLDDINGSNNGRRSGHAALRPPLRYRRAPLSSDPLSLTPARVEERAVYFKRRGAYEDMIYRPHHGSYQRQTGRKVGPRGVYSSAAAPRAIR